MRAQKNTRTELFKSICKMEQMVLKRYLSNRLKDYGYEVVTGDGYVYAKGSIPILLTAHMDTVHKSLPKTINEIKDIKGATIISSPQGIGGDDRCGIYIIMKILMDTDLRPSILFCEDEEIGGIGSEKFTKAKQFDDLTELRYMIELDRANANDAVFYECDNPEFTEYIEKITGYREAWGSFSDISTLAPAALVAAVNLSCGYYKAHTTQEYVNFEEMENTIEVVKKMLQDKDETQYEWIENVYSGYYGGWGKYGYGYGDYSGWYDDYDDDDYYGSGKATKKVNETEKEFGRKQVCLEIMTKSKTYVEYGSSEMETWGRFFLNHSDISFNDVYDYEMYTV